MTTALSTYALTTEATVFPLLGLSATNDNVKRSINAASDAIIGYCKREFGKATVAAEKHSGFGTKLMVLDRPPIVSLTSISYDGSLLSAADYEIFDAVGGIIACVYGVWTWTASLLNNGGQDPLPDSERKLYSVAYVGGYVLPKDDGTPARDLPYDVEQAAIELAIAFYRRYTRDPAIKAESLMSASFTYQDGGEIPPSVQALLARYRRG